MKKFFKLIPTLLIALGALSACTTSGGTSKVDNSKVKAVELDVNYLSLQQGDTAKLTPTITYKDDVEVKVDTEWRSNNTKVVTVSDDGEIVAVGGGNASVVFLAGYKSAACTIKVAKDDEGIPDPLPDEDEQEGFKLTIKSSSATIAVGGSFAIKATTTENGEPVEEVVTFTSENENIATVDASGLVTGRSEGYTRIKVQARTSILYCEITVSDEGGEEEDDDKTVEIYFFIDYNNIDFEDTTGKRMLAHFYWYPDQPLKNCSDVPADPLDSAHPTSDFPYFIGWSTHTIIDSKDQLWNMDTDVPGPKTALYLYGIWAAVPKGDFNL